MTSFFEQYKTPQWQRRRLERLEASGWKCASCGSADDQLHVHHTSYVRGRDVWDYPDKELVVLCDGCHAVAHQLAREMAALSAALPRGLLLKCFGYLLGAAGKHHFEAGTVTRFQIESESVTAGVADFFGVTQSDIENAMRGGEVFIEDILQIADERGGAK